MTDLLDTLSHPFVYRALFVGGAVSLAASLLGVVLVLKRFSLIGHGLADVGFASLAVGLTLGLSPFFVSLPVVAAAAVAIMVVSQRYGASGDVAIGMASTGALAAGVIVASRTSGFNVDVYNFMFGSILGLESADLVIAAALAALVCAAFVLFYNRIFLVCQDENFARAAGINVTFYHFLVALLTAMTVVVGMRMMGTLLISSLVIFPAVTARRLSTGFLGMVTTAAAVSVFCFLMGMALSLLLDWPTGASVVAVNVGLFLLVFVAGGARSVLGAKR